MEQMSFKACERPKLFKELIIAKHCNQGLEQYHRLRSFKVKSANRNLGSSLKEGMHGQWNLEFF